REREDGAGECGLHQRGFSRVSLHEGADYGAEAFPGRHLSRVPDGGIPGPDPRREDEERETPRAILRTGVEQSAREAWRQVRDLGPTRTRDFPVVPSRMGSIIR